MYSRWGCLHQNINQQIFFTLFPPLKEMLDDFSLVLMLHSMNVYFATVSYKQHSFNFQTLQKLPGIANAI